MCFMMENKVQDCSGWEHFECNLQVCKVVSIASVQETARLLTTEEELNRCQTFITSLSFGKESLVSLNSRFFLSKLSFLIGIFPSFSHSCLIVMLLLYLVFLSKLFRLSRWGICISMQMQTTSGSRDSLGTLPRWTVSVVLKTDIIKSTIHQGMDANCFCHQSQLFPWTPGFMRSRKVGSESLAQWWGWCWASAMQSMFFPQLNSTEPVHQEEHRG